MNTRQAVWSATLFPLGMLVLGACADGKGTAAQPAATPAMFVSTQFEDCGKGGSRNPSPVDVSEAAVADALHGVWVGTRTVRDGRSLLPRLRPGREPLSHYVMIYDMKARKGIGFEQSSPHIRENAFWRLLPARATGAPQMSFVNCAARFRDDFVKVSADPARGLRALQQVAGTALPTTSVAAAWNALQASGLFERKVEDVLTVGAFFDMSTSQVAGAGPDRHGVRLQMAARYRGTAAEFSHDGATSAVEGGVLQGISTTSGNYLVGPEVSSTKADTATICPYPDPDACREPGAQPSPPATDTGSETYRLIIGPLP